MQSLKLISLVMQNFRGDSISRSQENGVEIWKILFIYVEISELKLSYPFEVMNSECDVHLEVLQSCCSCSLCNCITEGDPELRTVDAGPSINANYIKSKSD